MRPLPIRSVDDSIGLLPPLIGPFLRGVFALPKRVLLIGHPVSHSLSSALQQAAFDELGIDARYEPVDVPLMTLTFVRSSSRSASSSASVRDGPTTLVANTR